MKFYGYEFFHDALDNEYVVLEMERCQSTLNQYLNKIYLENIVLDEKIKMLFAVQMIDGLNFLHLHDIIHKDVKLDNFLV